MGERAKGGKKNRKVGRNAKWCERYRLSNRRERNKLKRLNKHLARHPGDGCGTAAADRCRAIIRLPAAAE
jgi:hypothetical protein